MAGHTEEARILLRSVIELVLIAFLIYSSNDVFGLWNECFELRKRNTSKEGVVTVPEIRDRRFEVNEIIGWNKAALDSDSDVSPLVRIRGEFSTYYSHENLYNIVSRVEEIEGKTELYIGDHCESESGRMKKTISLTVYLIKTISKLVDRITSGGAGRGR
jgi:hypothetical protein